MIREEAIFCEKSYIGETNCIDCKYCGTETCQVRESHRMAIKALEQELKWIPVSEKLPEDKEIVLITSSDMYLSKLSPWCGWKNGNNWYTFTAKGSYLIKYPIAWMPLPKVYEPKESEDEK